MGFYTSVWNSSKMSRANVDPEQNLEEEESHKDTAHTANVVFVSLAVVLLLFLLAASLISSVHRVDEGHIGVYYRLGALMNESTRSGLQWTLPFVTTVEQLQYTPETRFLQPLTCTTKDGVRNIFKDVQVISSIDPNKALELIRQFGMGLKDVLINDRVIEAVQLFCANNTIDEVYNSRFLEIFEFVHEYVEQTLKKYEQGAADAIRIWNVFLPKPQVPPAIAQNYRQVKVEWTRQLVARQAQVTARIEQETDTMRAVLKAQKQQQVQQIEDENRLEQQQIEFNLSAIANAIRRDRLTSDAEAEAYVMETRARANEKLLTDNFVRMEVARMVANGTKFYFSGNDAAMGGILNAVFNRNNGNSNN